MCVCVCVQYDYSSRCNQYSNSMYGRDYYSPDYSGKYQDGKYGRDYCFSSKEDYLKYPKFYEEVGDKFSEQNAILCCDCLQTLPTFSWVFAEAER